MPRVLITTVPFAELDRTPLYLLEAAGISYDINPIGRRLKADEVVSLLPGYDAVIAGTEPITRPAIAGAAALRLIARVGIGVDNVDLAAAAERGVVVSYTPDAPSAAVAELTIGLMLDLLRGISSADRAMRGGLWRRQLGRRLSECTVGLIGLGRIGKKVAAHLRGGFPGVRIVANDLVPNLPWGLAREVEWVEKPFLYRTADIISLHLPLTPETRGLIGEAEINAMKPDALLINTSRGGMIRERDLAAALNEGRIAGAAIDVFDEEPYAGPLVAVDTCTLTAHMGSMARDCRARMELEATQEVIRLFSGQPLRSPVPSYEYVVQAAL